MDLPEGFSERLQEMFGASTAREVTATLTERPTTLRVNTLKATRDEVREQLTSDGFRLRPVQWLPLAFVLENRSKRELTDHPLYAAGKIYLQSLASMAPPVILNPHPGESILDLTAAPGSKTSQIAALMERKGTLIANDNNKVRFFKLKHNLELLGAFAPDDPFLRLRLEDGSRLCSEYNEVFDRVLLDAPCSAESRFILRDPRSFGYWKERKVKDMASTQRRLLFSAWRTVRRGGVLVYSTCTFAPEENEVQLSKFLERTPDAEVLPARISELATLPILTRWKGKELSPLVQSALRIRPTRDIEGFFIAVLRKSVTAPKPTETSN